MLSWDEKIEQEIAGMVNARREAALTHRLATRYAGGVIVFAVAGVVAAVLVAWS